MTDKPQNIDEIIQKCIASVRSGDGYLVFTARLTDRRDQRGFPIIEFDYSRHHFALKDAQKAVSELRRFVANDIRENVAEIERQDGELEPG